MRFAKTRRQLPANRELLTNLELTNPTLIPPVINCSLIYKSPPPVEGRKTLPITDFDHTGNLKRCETIFFGLNTIVVATRTENDGGTPEQGRSVWNLPAPQDQGNPLWGEFPAELLTNRTV
jgi:hypothetical protein